MALHIRSEVIEYGSLPLAPWLSRLDSLGAIKALMDQLHQLASYDDVEGRSECNRTRVESPSRSRRSNGVPPPLLCRLRHTSGHQRRSGH